MRNWDLWNMVAHNGPDTATSTSSTAQPQYVQDAQKNLIGLGQGMTSPFTATPAYSVAGLNTDQQAAFNGARDMFINEQNTTVPNGQNSATGNITSAQLSPGEIQQFQNPYNQQVLDNTYRNMRQQYDTQDADFGAKMAAAGAYGGSREAVGRSINQQNFQNNVSSTAANLMSQGFDKASALAMANAQMRQQAAIAQAQLQATIGGQNASNSMNASNSDYQRQKDALQQLLAVGNQQQQLSQSAIDAPWTALQRLTATTPSLNLNQGTTTSTQPVQDNTLGTVAGIAMMLPKLFSLSDETEKTDIRKIGTAKATDPETGEDKEVPVSSYRMKGDPKTYPKSVGPMAQDVEKVMPSAVKKIAGKKVVHSGVLAQLMNLQGQS